MARRTITLILTLLLAIGMAAPAVQAGPGEGDMLAKINAERSSRGLNTLSSHSTLVAHARSHSKAMADSDSIWHTPSSTLKSLVSGWERIGENVGRGPNVTILHSAFMNSSGHKANILGDFTHAGVGTYVTDDGMMYATVVFVKLSGSSPTTTTTTAPPTTTTTAPTTTTTEASAPSTTQPAPQQVSSPTPAPTTTTTLPPEPDRPAVSDEQVRKHSPEMGIQDRSPCKR